MNVGWKVISVVYARANSKN